MANTIECEIIEHGGLQLAMIIRNTDSMVPGSRFYTVPSSQFQVGLHTKSNGSVTKPHYYNRTPVTVKNPVQEIFHILVGKAKFFLYDVENKNVARTELLKGDTILLLQGTAHAVEFIEDTKMLEIKQGPFNASDKVTINTRNN